MEIPRLVGARAIYTKNRKITKISFPRRSKILPAIEILLQMRTPYLSAARFFNSRAANQVSVLYCPLPKDNRDRPYQQPPCRCPIPLNETQNWIGQTYATRMFPGNRIDQRPLGEGLGAYRYLSRRVQVARTATATPEQVASEAQSENLENYTAIHSTRQEKKFSTRKNNRITPASRAFYLSATTTLDHSR
jgi:hypothetical protein